MILDPRMKVIDMRIQIPPLQQKFWTLKLFCEGQQQT